MSSRGADQLCQCPELTQSPVEQLASCDGFQSYSICCQLWRCRVCDNVSDVQSCCSRVAVSCCSRVAVSCCSRVAMSCCSRVAVSCCSRVAVSCCSRVAVSCCSRVTVSCCSRVAVSCYSRVAVSCCNRVAVKLLQLCGSELLQLCGSVLSYSASYSSVVKIWSDKLSVSRDENRPFVQLW